MKRTKLRHVSKKRQEELAIYAKKRAERMIDAMCEAADCWKPATEIHHIRGRNGKRLNDERYWFFTCREHHRWIHDNPKQAREYGWIDT